MPDPLPTIREAEDHTIAKHQILELYLSAWTIILSRHLSRTAKRWNEPIIVDGFAGPGEYEQGEIGSPILALRAVLEHPHDFPVPIRFLFIEKDQERYENLSRILRQYDTRIAETDRISVVGKALGDCETILNRELDKSFGKKSGEVGPAFFFLDQFGYSDISMQLIRKIMLNEMCEVFSYLNWQKMNQFMNDKTKWPAISKAYGGSEWQKVFDCGPGARERFMLDTYKNALRRKAGVRYVWHFAMCDRHNRLIYWLFFCTNNPKGLLEMKSAMWKVDQTGRFRFSDKNDPRQLSLLKDFTDDLLSNELVSNLCGSKVTIENVEEFVLTETPSYLYRKVLKQMEKNGNMRIISAPAERIVGTFPEKYKKRIVVEFISKSIHY